MAQKTVAQLTAEIASELPTNGANLITAADLRGVLVDMVDSAGNLSDGTPATLYSANGALAGNRTVDGATYTLTVNNLGGLGFTVPNSGSLTFSQDLVDITANFAFKAQFNPSQVGPWSSIRLDQNELLLSSGDGDYLAQILLLSQDGDYANIEIKSTDQINVGNGETPAISVVPEAGGTLALGGDTTDQLSFYGGSGVARQANADQAVATDPASTMALANALRAALVALNLIKGAA
jgi:hypothetical protein